MRPSRSRCVTTLVSSVAALVMGAGAPSFAQSYHHAQGGFVTWPWVWQDPSASSHYRVWTAEDGARIRFQDTQTGTWSFQTTPASQTKPYRFISFYADGINGVAVGDGGQWVWTMQGDQPNGLWKVTIPGNYVVHPLDSSLNPRLWAISLDPTKNWVVGQKGLLAWNDNFLGTGLTPATFVGTDPFVLNVDLHGIDFTADRVHGVALGNSPGGVGKIYYTDDSGLTWDDASISFLDENCNSAAAPGDLTLWKASFSKASGSLIGHAVGIGDGRGRVFRTTNGGSSWTEEPYSYQCSGSVPNCQISPNPCTGTTLITLAQTQASLAEMYGVHTFDDGGALAVGYGAMVVERPFNSSTWLSRTDRCAYPTGPLWGVHGDGQSTAWITGHSNQIRRTDDRGQSWTQEGWDKHWRLMGIAVVSTGGSPSGPVLWTVGQQRRIARSLDLGATWTEQYAYLSGAEYGRNTTAIAVYDDLDASVANDVGAAVGVKTAAGGWMLLSTTSGGNSCWAPATITGAPPPTPRDLWAVCASGRNASNLVEFWAVGSSDAILVSRDNGATWSVLSSPTTGVTWKGVAFSSLDEGWIVGEKSGQGYALHVTQGSATPVLTLLPTTSATLEAVHSRNANCYAVGSSGSVFKYNPALAPAQFELVAGSTGLTTKTLSAVFVARKIGGFEVFAGGLDGVVLRFDGTSWSKLPKSQTSSDISSMAFVTASSGFALGRQGMEAEIGGQSTLVRYSNP